MLSRERVLTTFAHQQPDRVPLWFGMSPEFQANAKRQLGVDDEGLLRSARRRLPPRLRPLRRAAGSRCSAADATYRTPFGVERHGLGYGQPIATPLADATLAQIHDYAWPDPAWMDVSQHPRRGPGLRPAVRDPRRRLVALLARRDRPAGHGGPAAARCTTSRRWSMPCCSTSWITMPRSAGGSSTRRPTRSTSSSSATISAASAGRWSARSCSPGSCCRTCGG